MANYSIKLNKNLFIPMYYDDLNRWDKQVQIFFGGRGSGKSHYVYQKILYKAMLEPKSVTLIVRELRNSLKASVFKAIVTILEEWRLLKYCKVNNTELTITLPNKAMLYFIGADNPSSIKSMPIISRIVYEEADFLSLEDYETFSSSIRGEGFTQGEIFIFNPPTHEFFVFDLYLHSINMEELYENKMMETDICRVWHSCYLDNPFTNRERLDAKYNNLKERNYHRWLRDALGRLSAPEDVDNIYTQEMIVNATKYNYEPKKTDSIIAGLDVARFGDDRSALAIRHGNKVLPLKYYKNKRAYEIAERVYKNIIEYVDSVSYKGKIILNIDATGTGSGVADAFSDMKKSGKFPKLKQFKINEVNFSNKAIEDDLYTDIISESAFAIKKLLEDGEIQLPRDKSLIEEMGLRKRDYDNKHRDKLESKKDFKKRINRSPDSLDAVLLCFVKIKKSFFFC